MREFYSALPRPVRVGIEATGSLQWFINLLEELGIECQVGNSSDPGSRAAEAARLQGDTIHVGFGLNRIGRRLQYIGGSRG